MRPSSSFAWRDEHEELIPAARVAEIDRANRSARLDALARPEGRDMSAAQATLSAPGSSAGRGQGHGHAAGLSEDAQHGASKRIVVAFGFWIFLISDIILFAALFATYAVLTDSTAGGPSGRDLFDLRTVAIETGCLLTSTVFCGLAGIGAQAQAQAPVLWRDGRHLRARCDLRRDRAARVRGHDRRGRRPDAQRLPVGILRPDRMPRPARHAPACCGC